MKNIFCRFVFANGEGFWVRRDFIEAVFAHKGKTVVRVAGVQYAVDHTVAQAMLIVEGISE
jgi:hypothetical protein